MTNVWDTKELDPSASVWGAKHLRLSEMKEARKTTKDETESLRTIFQTAELISRSWYQLRAGRQIENHSHRKLTNLITWITVLFNSMKLWSMLCGATQDRWVMVESFDKMWSTGVGNGKPLQYSCLGDPTNTGAWWTTLHMVARQTWLSN